MISKTELDAQHKYSTVKKLVLDYIAKHEPTVDQKRDFNTIEFVKSLDLTHTTGNQDKIYNAIETLASIARSELMDIGKIRLGWDEKHERYGYWLQTTLTNVVTNDSS